jgi:hypothetical protein
VLPAAAYGGHKDVNEAWVAGTLAVGVWLTPGAAAGVMSAVPAVLVKVWEERIAIMLADSHLLPADAERLAWEGLQGFPQSSMAAHAGHDRINTRSPGWAILATPDRFCGTIGLHYTGASYNRGGCAMPTMIDGESCVGRILIRPLSHNRLRVFRSANTAHLTVR